MQYTVVSPSPTSCTVQRDLSEFLNRLLEMERLATAHEWWMYGRVLPEARRIIELISLLAAARAELFGLLKSTGFPQLADFEHLGASELIFASPFANDLGWAQTHREESLQVFRLAASSVRCCRWRQRASSTVLTGTSAAPRPTGVKSRITARLTESRTFAMDY